MKWAESPLTMNLPLTLIACLVPAHTAPAQQDPVPHAAPVVPLPSDPSQKLDVLELKNGDELVGRITSELDGYVEIEIEDGATIGVSRAMVKNVRKQAVAMPLRAAVVRPDDAWFVLHDADGASVGWLHTSITTANDGTFAVNEEYEFVNGARRYQITNQCSADPNGRGVHCYYRERVSQPKLRGRLTQPRRDRASGSRTNASSKRASRPDRSAWWSRTSTAAAAPNANCRGARSRPSRCWRARWRGRPSR